LVFGWDFIALGCGLDRQNAVVIGFFESAEYIGVEEFFDFAEGLQDGFPIHRFQPAGAKQAVVWLRIDDTLQPEGVWQADREAALVEPVPTDGLVEDQFGARRPVQHNEHLFGALSVTKPRNDAITPTDAALLADVAAGAGLLLRNISLNRQLEDRARELRESRRRLITAQDTERHRLERDLHDGAQQQVVALKVKLGIAKTVAEQSSLARLKSIRRYSFLAPIVLPLQK